MTWLLIGDLMLSKEASCLLTTHSSTECAAYRLNFLFRATYIFLVNICFPRMWGQQGVPLTRACSRLSELKHYHFLLSY